MIPFKEILLNTLLFLMNPSTPLLNIILMLDKLIPLKELLLPTLNKNLDSLDTHKTLTLMT